MHLSSIMNFEGMTQEQLVQLLDSLYALLLKSYEQRVLYIPATPSTIPAGSHPLYPVYSTTVPLHSEATS